MEQDGRKQKVRVFRHLAYDDRPRGKQAAKTRCGYLKMGDAMVNRISEVTCEFCLYWAKRGKTQDTWQELWPEAVA